MRSFSLLIPSVGHAAIIQPEVTGRNAPLLHGLCRALTNDDSATCHNDNYCYTTKRSWLLFTKKIKTELECDEPYAEYLKDVYKLIPRGGLTGAKQPPIDSKGQKECRSALQKLPATLGGFFSLKKRRFWSSPLTCSRTDLAHVVPSTTALTALADAYMLIPGLAYHVPVVHKSSSDSSSSMKGDNLIGDAPILIDAINEALNHGHADLAARMMFFLGTALMDGRNVDLLVNWGRYRKQAAWMVTLAASHKVFATIKPRAIYDIFRSLTATTSRGDTLVQAAVYLSDLKWPVKVSSEGWECSWYEREMKALIIRPQGQSVIPIPWRALLVHTGPAFRKCTDQVLADMKSTFDTISRHYGFAKLSELTVGDDDEDDVGNQPIGCWGLLQAVNAGFQSLLTVNVVPDREYRCKPLELSGIVKQYQYYSQLRGILLLSHHIPSLLRGLVEHTSNNPRREVVKARPSLERRRWARQGRHIEDELIRYQEQNKDLCDFIPSFVTQLGSSQQDVADITYHFTPSMSWLLAHCARR